MIDDVVERGLCQLKSWSLRYPVVFCISVFLFSRLLFWLLAFWADVYLGFPWEPHGIFLLIASVLTFFIQAETTADKENEASSFKPSH